MIYKQKIRTILAYAQALLLITIVGSGMLFMHKHQTSSGKIVIHVHPYNLKTDPEGAKHQHTDNEAHFLDVVFNGSYLQADIASVETPMSIILTGTLFQKIPSNITQQPDLKIFLRGPPQFLI